MPSTFKRNELKECILFDFCFFFSQWVLDHYNVVNESTIKKKKKQSKNNDLLKMNELLEIIEWFN